MNEATITGVLTRRNSAHHHQIKAAYLQEKGKPLDEALKKALPGHHKDFPLALLNTPARLDAHELCAALIYMK